jgi:hypothetical protein
VTDVNRRQVQGKPDVYGQGTLEQVVYIFHLDNMLEGKGVASSPVCKLWDLGTGSDVSAGNLSGAASYDGGTFELTSPIVLNLQKDVLYRLVAQVQVGTQQLSCYKDIRGEL